MSNQAVSSSVITSAAASARKSGHMLAVGLDPATITAFITALFAFLQSCKKKNVEERMAKDRKKILAGVEVNCPPQLRKLYRDHFDDIHAGYRASVLDGVLVADKVASVAVGV